MTKSKYELNFISSFIALHLWRDSWANMIMWMKVFRIIPEFRILRLNFAGNNSFSDLVSVYLKVFDHLTNNFEFLIIWRHTASFTSFKFWFLKFRFLENLNFHLCD